MKGAGRDKLWAWFGLSYASWLALPRALMHEMPDVWQAKMAALLEEWDAHWDGEGDFPADTVVQTRDARKRFTRPPEWATNYRRPNRQEIAAHARSKASD